MITSANQSLLLKELLMNIVSRIFLLVAISSTFTAEIKMKTVSLQQFFAQKMNKLSAYTIQLMIKTVHQESPLVIFYWNRLMIWLLWFMAMAQIPVICSSSLRKCVVNSSAFFSQLYELMLIRDANALNRIAFNPQEQEDSCLEASTEIQEHKRKWLAGQSCSNDRSQLLNKASDNKVFGT